MNKDSIRKQVSNIVGVRIADGEWDEIFAQLDRENRLNNKAIAKILLVILKRLEENEQTS